ncbi:tRNA uridine(34) 5-carboxymethylaminomethyl modification radical SAM/GNAT enzyme Elp3 [Candidatus Micrarchaeota archaeon]|nr:tRNA uridine(34) 5-carboxymethylaminomethyl modification radical SAM/GNAT enzyme Elp3 [Candidatus Micrarchaeota archaeon]
MNKKKILEFTLDKILNGVPVEKAKLIACGKFKLTEGIRNSELLKIARSNIKYEGLKSLLVKRITRTISGVTPVAVMTNSTCPHGRCIYCPRGDKAPQSYTGKEPAALRAEQNHFDPWLQVKARLRQYEETGHPTDKCELIIMGGTFLAQSLRYKYDFIKGCYDAFNDRYTQNLKIAKKMNETARHRIIGLTIETRPDWCKKAHIDEMLTYGATRVELGVQTLRNDIYKRVERGHTIEDVVNATRWLKDSGFKICYHIMPGLMVSKNEDIEMYKQLFTDERFQPDMLKIYPTMVMQGTKLYDMWKKGQYKPYDTNDAVEVISEMYRYIPEYVRVMRVQRDIPTPLITAGVMKSNLRELVEREAESKGIKIKEIRYREIGLSRYKTDKNKTHKYETNENSEPKIDIITYTASKGREYFISYKNDDALFGFVRLRIPYMPFRKEITEETGLIRELHVYGYEVPISEEARKAGQKELAAQHKGIGRLLMEKAEQIAVDEGMKYMIVISGVGVREYYRKLGYSLKGAYMWKRLNH